MDQRQARRITEYPIGRWVNFLIDDDGMTSITYESLSSIIDDLSSVDPRSFSIFMSNELGRARTQAINQTIPENLMEIGIMVDGENDGSFDSSDKIIFYGRGSSGFDVIGSNVEWHQNVYFTENSCWLLIPDDEEVRGKRIDPAEQPTTGTLMEYGISSFHHETDLINLEASGTRWVGSPVLAGGSQAIITSLPSPKSGVDVSVKAHLLAHSLSETSNANHTISLHHGSLNGVQIGSTTSWSTSTITIVDDSPGVTLNDGANIFYLKNSSSDGNSSPYLDYFEIHYGRELHFSNTYEFTSPLIGQDLRFNFSSNPSSSELLWDITDLENPKSLEIIGSGYANTTIPSNSLGRYVVFDKENLPTVSNLVLKETQVFNSLRRTDVQAEYLVVGPEQFRSAAADLIQLRSPAVFASLETVYAEFSAGNEDPMAIRSCIQWTQENWQTPQPNCLLLLGDGGYDYRNITGNSSIVVPTIQIQTGGTYATDDRFATIYGNDPAIALGRFPAKNENEVEDFVEKVIHIETNTEFGPWRQRLTLVADDAARPEPKHGSIATGKSHTQNSDELAELVPSSIFADKLYMMEFPEVSNASAYGVIKPDATEALFNKLNSGTAIISYIGHGSPYQLAQEKLLSLDRGDINSINTGAKLPLWIVGTCSFGHFGATVKTTVVSCQACAGYSKLRKQSH